MDFSRNKKNKSVITRGVQLVPIGIHTLCLYNSEPNLKKIYCPKDNGKCHNLSGMIKIISFRFFRSAKMRISFQAKTYFIVA